MCVYEPALEEIRKSEIYYVMMGLLRTSDYETLVAALSLLGTLLKPGHLEVLTKVKLIPLFIKQLQKKEIEFTLHIQTILHSILEDKTAKALRKALLDNKVQFLLQEQEFIPEFGVIPSLVTKI